MFVFIIILLIIIITYFLYNNKSENMDNSNTKPILSLYYAEWCGHCKNVMPIWNKLSNNKVLCKKYDCDKNKNICEANNVTGFPTILLHLSDKVIKYNGDRSYDDLNNFINTNIN